MSRARPLLLDLFCGQGGAAAGFAAAGFDVRGVDVHPQPRYPFPFVQADALAFLDGGGADGFAAVHASPPCQRWSAATKRNRTSELHPDLIGPIRGRLAALGLPYVLENVPGAPLVEPELACGSAFGITHGGYRLRRHRLFEASFPLVLLGCGCAQLALPMLDVSGGGDCRRPRLDGGGGRPRKGSAAEVRALMEMPWATKGGCNEAVHPRYAREVGRQLLSVV